MVYYPCAMMHYDGESEARLSVGAHKLDRTLVSCRRLPISRVHPCESQSLSDNDDSTNSILRDWYPRLSVNGARNMDVTCHMSQSYVTDPHDTFEL